MTDSGTPNRLHVKKVRNARRRRLELRRIKSALAMDNFKPGIDPHSVTDQPTTGAGKESKTDGGSEKLKSELSLSLSGPSASELSDHSSEIGGTPVGILASGGEVSGEEESRRFTCLSHGSISVIGRRRVMEDAVTVAPGVIAAEFASYEFFAVYDGHGGSRVAHACRDRLHQLLGKEIEGRRWMECGGGGGGVGIDWEKVMMACFSKMDEEVNGGSGVEVDDGTVSVKTMGSTAVVVMVGKEELVVANCGDSRAVVCRGGVAVPLSRDHKPDRPDEMERVEAAGGRVINWNGCRVLGVLATSRSIGDHYLKPYVISEPEVTVSKRTEPDDFLIIASDGLWDVLSNEVACDVVKRCLDGQIKRRFSEGVSGSSAAEAAAMLAELAMAKGSKDNISVIVVVLKKSNCSIS